jgi:hypothetical protein
MTLSQFIERYAKDAYLRYCEQNHITPEIDTVIKEPKLCALVKPALDSKPKKPYN